MTIRDILEIIFMIVIGLVFMPIAIVVVVFLCLYQIGEAVIEFWEILETDWSE